MPKKREAAGTSQAHDRASTMATPAYGEQLARSAQKAEAALPDMVRAARRVQSDHQLSPLELTTLLAGLAARTLWKPLPPVEPLPHEASELWSRRDLNLRENAPNFTKRVYAAWLGHGLARKDIARLDADLYKALSVWLTRHPDDETARLLPSQSDQIDEAIERLSAEYSVEFLRKLGYAIDTRLRRQQK